MIRRLFETFAWLTLAASLGGCASSTPAADSAASSGMSSADARAFIAEVQTSRGVQPGAPVTSMDQFLEVLESDDVTRFESAAAFVAGKPGVDAMTLHAAVELAWSDDYTTVSKIVEELRKRAEIEVKRLREQKESGRAFGADDEKKLDAAEKSVEFRAKAREALQVLARDHLATALGPVNEALRQFPKDPRTYRVAAYYYLLAADWEKYDSAMEWFKEGSAGDAGIQYVRAMETLNRFAIRREARDLFKKALEQNPKLVRSQAKLVFAEEGIAERHAELEKLRVLAPKHPIVNIAGPHITSEYEMSASLAQARGEANPAPSPAPAAAPTTSPTPPAASPAPATSP